jgi:hypothetical protein
MLLQDRNGDGGGPDWLWIAVRCVPLLALLAGLILGLILGHHLLAAGSGIGLVLLRRFSLDYRRPDGTQVRIRLDGPE